MKWFGINRNCRVFWRKNLFCFEFNSNSAIQGCYVVSQNNWEISGEKLYDMDTSFENNNKRLFRPIIFHGSSVHAFDLDQSKPVLSVARKSILSCQVFAWIWNVNKNKAVISISNLANQTSTGKNKNCWKLCEFNFI